MDRFERRKYKRLPIKLALLCFNVCSTAEEFHRGCTINVCPGGLYFATPAGIFKPGKLLKIELLIPPTAGVLEFGDRISGFANVLRAHTICELHTDSDLPSARYGVALRFCQPPKLCIYDYYLR